MRQAPRGVERVRGRVPHAGARLGARRNGLGALARRPGRGVPVAAGPGRRLRPEDAVRHPAHHRLLRHPRVLRRALLLCLALPHQAARRRLGQAHPGLSAGDSFQARHQAPPPQISGRPGAGGDPGGRAVGVARGVPPREDRAVREPPAVAVHGPQRRRQEARGRGPSGQGDDVARHPLLHHLGGRGVVPGVRRLHRAHHRVGLPDQALGTRHP
mmetsp:Transcript_20576/g.49097  ORF Transcript_20576/g.49097 Transcript_20576/m.49097 type:complete len:214 (+) Transcript_20576:2629-3270(+)